MCYNDRRTLCMTGATIAWTAALGFGVAGTVEDSLPVLFWAVFVSLIANVATAYLLIQSATKRERVRVERLVDGLVAAAEERMDLPRIR